MNIAVSLTYMIGLRNLLSSMMSDMSITNGYFDVVGDYLRGLNTLVSQNERYGLRLKKEAQVSPSTIKITPGGSVSFN